MYGQERPRYSGRSYGNPFYNPEPSIGGSGYRLQLSPNTFGYVSHRMENPFSKKSIKELPTED
ncbi:MAG: hypothetical protein HY367_03315 [Candidatus Aenigmarchaeota archaeon]|nr:hypothetical protein [Candidatus Aenigmarchaeota archaeon]